MSGRRDEYSSILMTPSDLAIYGGIWPLSSISCSVNRLFRDAADRFPMAGSWPMPIGLEVRAIPPVIKVGAEEYAARDLSSSFEMVKAQREAAILDAIASYRPDFF
ncbi:hypothetical protein GGI1_22554, partial [Acidithiobacillus sp. GGI-221]